MDGQSLRDWVHRYNAEGLIGLVNRRAPGPCPGSRLSWERRGTRPRAVRGVGAGAVMPGGNVEATTTHLAGISRSVGAGARAVLVLNGAGWHTSPRLGVPDSTTLLPLPAHAPELNPLETLWEFLRADLLSHRVWEGCEAIAGACCDARDVLTYVPERVTSVTSRAWARVSI